MTDDHPERYGPRFWIALIVAVVALVFLYFYWQFQDKVGTGQYVPGSPVLWEGGIRLDVDAEWIAGVVERAAPAIRSDFDVYHDSDRLLYTGGECGDEDVAPPFFLHVFPEDEGDLPEAHRENGYHHLDFRFDARRLPLDFYFKDTPAPNGVGCAALVDLPGYEVARISTGQYVPDGPVLWDREIRLDVDAGWIAGVVERAEPAIRSDFDVYHDGDRLLYTGGECGDGDVAPPFFLHVFPEDEGDLPAAHREHGYHHLDFRFDARRLPLDFHFKDAPAPNGVGCAALVDLPGYELARIRTGQYVPDGPVLWDREIRLDVDAGWIAGVVERATPAIRSDFDVYHDGDRLLYTGGECGDGDVAPPFFLHVFPEDEGDLPEAHREHGHHNLDFRFDARRLPLDFHFKDRQLPSGVKCIALVELPGYELVRIRTGQYVPDGPVLWDREIRLDVDAGWIAGVVERTEPAIRSDFDVYHDGDRLLYTGGECGDGDVAPPFFLHVFPEDEGDLPAAHREHGLHNLDFRFDARRLPLDLYFKDVPAPNGVKCIALIDLPGYELARIRTGQYVPGGPQLWHGEFEVVGKTP